MRDNPDVDDTFDVSAEYGAQRGRALYNRRQPGAITNVTEIQPLGGAKIHDSLNPVSAGAAAGRLGLAGTHSLTNP